MSCVVLAGKGLGWMLCRVVEVFPFFIVCFSVRHDGMVHFVGESFIIVDDYCAIGHYFGVLVGGKPHFWRVPSKEF